MNTASHREALEDVLSMVAVRTGLVFSKSRRSVAEEQIRRAARDAGAASLAQYGVKLREEAPLLARLVDALTVGETYFFRQPEHFEFIRREVLPAYACTRPESAVFRSWSAGCASGEEPYSLAIVAAEEGFGGRARILATDISRTALGDARRAVFRPWAFRGVDEAVKGKYFRPADGALRLIDPIRRAVQFEMLNLAIDDYPSSANGTWATDLILCRNVLIYFDRSTIREIARRLFAALAPGGWLLTAGSDPPLQDLAPFDVVPFDGGFAYRRRDAEGASVAVPSGRETALALTPEPGVGKKKKAIGGVRAAAPKNKRPQSLRDARRAFEHGDYARCAAITAEITADPAAAALHLRAIANSGTPEAAEAAATEALRRHPLVAEVQFLRAMLFLDLGRDEEAERAIRRAVFLDPFQALPHFILGSILQRRGDPFGALRAYRNVRDLLTKVDPGEFVPFSDGETAGALKQAAEQRMVLLERDGKVADA